MALIGNMTTESLQIALSGIVIVFLMLSLLACIVVLMSKIVLGLSNAAEARKKRRLLLVRKESDETAIPVADEDIIDETQENLDVELIGVDELTAACIMAIVSDNTGIALSELNFKSIKAV